MQSVPQPIKETIAELYGDRDTPPPARQVPARPSVQHAVVQAAEQVAAQPPVPVDPARLAKAMDLVFAHAVTLLPDGTARVKSGSHTYHLAPDCTCEDAQRRGTGCKHALAVLVHRRALALLDGTAPAPASNATPAAPSASPPAAAAAPPPAALPAAPSAPPQPKRQARTRSSAAWDVHEAPLSTCLKLRLGPCEWTHTVRASDETELRARFSEFKTLVHDMAAELNELALHLEASHVTLRDALERQRAAAQAAAPAPPAPQTPAPQPVSAPADLQALIQQAVQQALAAHANGQAPGTPPPAAPSPGTAPSAPVPDDQQTGLCSMHQVQMEHKHNARGTFYGHWLADEQRHCNGRRNGRR